MRLQLKYGLIPMFCSVLPMYAAEQLPNVIFILADDMGIGDLGCYGQEVIKTPNIDQLSDNGLRFINHYSGSSVSAPSRCCLMTGKHTGNAYIRGNKRVDTADGPFDLHIPESETTVAELFKQKGYATMCVGKWGLGGVGTSGSPMNSGYDYFYGYLSQLLAHSYYPEYLFENETKVMLNGQTYSHDLIMEKGLSFLRTLDTSTPFFAYMALTPPHADLDIPDLGEYDEMFDETPYQGNGHYKPQAQPKAAYAAMVSEIDRNVGQVVALLKEKGCLDNTIIIFSSDNGVHTEAGHTPTAFDSNGPYRGSKRDLYEGGIHVPFIVSWPKQIAQGRTTEHISTFWDFLPTMCELIGVDQPATTDGISYLPTLLNKLGEQTVHSYIYHEFHESNGRQSIQKDGYKLVRYNVWTPKQIKEELFYLPDDIGETRNIASTNKAKVAELRKLAREARTESSVYPWKDTMETDDDHTCPDVTVNELLNADFEDETNHWQLTQDPNNPTSVNTGKNGLNGSMSLKLGIAAKKTTCAAQQSLTLEPGALYHFTGYCYYSAAPSGNNKSKIRIINEEDQSEIYSYTIPVDGYMGKEPPTTILPRCFSFTPPIANVSIRIENGSIDKLIRFDNLAIFKDATTAFENVTFSQNEFKMHNKQILISEDVNLETLRMYNVTGQLLKTPFLTQRRIDLDVLQTGLYILNATTIHGKKGSLKFQIN